MWGIDRVGQKVQCVQDEFIWQFVCWELPCYPRLDAIYTISGFGEIEQTPGVYLAELSGVSCPCLGLNNAPWPIECFRPLDQRATDIGELTKILDRTPQRAFESEQFCTDAVRSSVYTSSYSSKARRKSWKSPGRQKLPCGPHCGALQPEPLLWQSWGSTGAAGPGSRPRAGWRRE